MLQKSKKLPSEDLFDVFLYQLDSRSLRLASISGKYPEICDNENFWKRRLELQSNGTRINKILSYKETWHIYYMSIMYIFEFEHIREILPNQYSGFCHPEISIVDEHKEYYDSYFYKRVEGSIQDTISELGVHKCTVSISDKNVYITIFGIVGLTQTRIINIFKDSIERSSVRRKVNDIVDHLYSLRVKSYSTLDL